MFSGIIEAKGTIKALEFNKDSARLSINAGGLAMDDVKLGDSIAVSGACLTVVDFDAKSFTVDVSEETLKLTTLGDKQQGSDVNLEKALMVSDRLGGHIVTGHVDGVGTVVQREDLDDYVKYTVEAPSQLSRYIAKKGSICVDGISLTVNAVNNNHFELMIIPHTLTVTTLGQTSPNSKVNLEIDVVARYCERLLETTDATSG
ncbi:MAG: riboflavin synthase [Gammaproteobacteria bacterium]